MAEDREQGPHYIPELDPENPKHPRGPFARFILRFLWVTFAGGLGFLIAGGVAWYAGFDQLAILFAIISAALLISFFALGGF